MLIAFRELVGDLWMEDGYRSKGPVHVLYDPVPTFFPRASISCVEIAHPSILYVSIIWFSCKLGPLIRGIGFCTLRAQAT
jgi:hypothetical protein